MRKGDKEFCDLMTQFEKNVKEITYGHNVERDKSGIKGVWYTDGYINTLFDAYMHGYEYAKCLVN